MLVVVVCVLGEGEGGEGGEEENIMQYGKKHTHKKKKKTTINFVFSIAPVAVSCRKKLRFSFLSNNIIKKGKTLNEKKNQQILHKFPVPHAATFNSRYCSIHHKEKKKHQK